VGDPDLRLLAHFDEHPVPSLGVGAPTIAGAAGAEPGAELSYESGAFGSAVRIAPGAELTYPITGNLSLEAGTLSLWANVRGGYGQAGTGRHYLFAASKNPSDSERSVYTSTLALRHEETAEGPIWNFWTVDDEGVRHDLAVPDSLQPGWHHFAVSWKAAKDGSAAEKWLYIDGVPVAEASAVTLPSFAGDTLQVGRWLPTYGEIDAAIDELAVFGRPLRSVEIATLARRIDFRTGQPGPLDQSVLVGDQEVVLDTNAIDRQGGVVSVRLRRDGEAWGDPTAYYDSYRWSISGDEGQHTFAVEYRDRSNNVAVVTTTVTFAAPATGSVELLQSTARSATLAIVPPAGNNPEVRLSQSIDFDDAEWQEVQEEMEWKWLPGKPRILYIQFHVEDSLAGPAIAVGPDLQHVFVPLVGSVE
jgi:hypothetical protein